jgi:hypothetical protein
LSERPATEDQVLLAPHQLRVVQEAHEVAEKHAKLGIFLLSPARAQLSWDEQSLLQEQWHAMAGYLHVLGKRLALFRAQAAEDFNVG